MDAAMKVLKHAEKLFLTIHVCSYEEPQEEPYLVTDNAEEAYEEMKGLEYINTVKFYKWYEGEGYKFAGTVLMSTSKDYEPDERVIDYTTNEWIEEALEAA